MRPRLRFLALVPSLAAAFVVGCAADTPDDALDEGSSDLTASNCELGSTCSDAIQLLHAVSFSNGSSSTGRFRTDLTIDAPGNPHPRAVRQTTTGLLRLKPGALVRLAGDARGEKGFSIDDNLLVEVLDAHGAVLSAAVAGAGGIRRGGAPVPALGPVIPVGSRPMGPRDIELSFLLPKDAPFKIRTSLLDNGGPAAIDDVWLLSGATAAAAPDPFDPASCTDAPLTAATAGPLFAPGATSRALGKLTWSLRKQTCNPVSGCTPWQTVTGPASFTMTTPIYSSRTDFDTVAIPVPLTADLELRILGSGPTTHVGAVMSTPSVHYAYRYEDRNDGFQTTCTFAAQSGAQTCHETLTQHADVNIGPQVLAPGPAPTGGYLEVFGGVVGKSCTRLVQRRTFDGTTYELVAFGRY